MFCKIPGFFGQIGVDTTLSPIDIECGQVTDMHNLRLNAQDP
jgi:hypothetical protein